MATLEQLEQLSVTSWEDIDSVLSGLGAADVPRASGEELARNAAFATFDYGIDGVSIEISKYAHCLEALASEQGVTPTIHLIGGDFHPQANSVVSERWLRCRLHNANGWAKWEGGAWFNGLFYEEMAEGSAASTLLATEIWRQALALTRSLCEYLREHDIRLLVVVNVNSNPGNLAFALALVLASELTGSYVINSNHDFYWEGGRPATEWSDGVAPGLRDHFFRNCSNRAFFRVFQALLPWNGRRWLQVNINRLQSQRLVEEYGLASERVSELGTGLSEDFFSPWDLDARRSARARMAYILSDGRPTIQPVSVEEHVAGLPSWMGNQAPVVCGIREGLELDITSERALYLLQPTRIIARKRIERDWWLVEALLEHEPFRSRFEADPNTTLTLHITGPVPIEHEADLRSVIRSYTELCARLPDGSAERLFLAFSVGHEDHPALSRSGLSALDICGIYRMANLVLLPSETEGRGLPIVESNAVGVPIVCSRYAPTEVFDDVVGAHLSPDQRLVVLPFPELQGPADVVDAPTLAALTDCLWDPASRTASLAVGRRAAHGRYGMATLRASFRDLLEHLMRTT